MVAFAGPALPSRRACQAEQLLRHGDPQALAWHQPHARTHAASRLQPPRAAADHRELRWQLCELPTSRLRRSVPAPSLAGARFIGAGRIFATAQPPPKAPQDLAERGEEAMNKFLEGLASASSSDLTPEYDDLEDVEMTPLEHLEEFRQRTIRAGVAFIVAVCASFTYVRPLVGLLEGLAPATTKFLQLSPGEYLFSTIKLSAYAGFLLSSPYILYEVLAYISPALRRSEKRVLFPLLFGSAGLFALGLLFSYYVLTPAAINFFVSFSDGAVEEMWSFDMYLDFVSRMFVSTGLASQVPIAQVLLGTLGIVTSAQMFAAWRYVVVGAMVAAAVLTPSTDPVTQLLLAGPLVGLYMGGCGAVKLLGK
eukprot:tig00020830_g14413.t1